MHRAARPGKRAGPSGATLGVLLVLAAAVPTAGPVVAAPRIELPTEEIDLGRIDRGSSAEARFVLRNTGDEDLKIEEPEPG